ncbi:MAG: hypothetical protein DRG24_00750 [Epsilonproteobacteria bacterium]|nr:MAG: hypothetical protein DRG24_00750 [Campylobacterota bacterium]
MTENNLETLIRSGKNLNILYVEDGDVVRDSTTEVLKMFFGRVDTAENGEIGYQKYQQFFEKYSYTYDMVITDINMPKMNGIEMIEAIFSINSKEHIIVTSAHNESHYLLKLINLGISNFILKPIDIDQLQKVLSRVVQIIAYEKEHKAINDNLRLEKEEATRSSLQKSKFLANMSHEIRTPLNAITGFISLLSEEETDPKKLKYLSVVQNSSDSLLHIINDILDISKIESGKLDIEALNFNPYKDLITVAELFQAKAAEKGVVLKIQYNHYMPNVLYSDALRIKQILSNLLSNAIKFTPKGANVKCIIWYKNGALHIRVKDYGIGIPADKHESIFDSFSQADSSTAREYGGTGLGLTISAKLTKMLGGTLTLKSVEGKGSCFLLHIAMPLGRKEMSSSSTSLSKLDLSGKHILLVDDMETNQMFIGIILDNAGMTHEVAQNGLEAIEKFKTGKYDLILMDENMPKLGGVGATKEILEIEKKQALVHTPIISLTANALKGDRERFLNAGMDDYLSKPIAPNILLQTLGHYLQASKNSSEDTD